MLRSRNLLAIIPALVLFTAGLSGSATAATAQPESYADRVLADTPFLFWKLDETTGPVARPPYNPGGGNLFQVTPDASTNGNDGYGITPSSHVAALVNDGGKSIQADPGPSVETLYAEPFGGSANGVLSPYFSSSAANGLTLEAWVKGTQLTGDLFDDNSPHNILGVADPATGAVAAQIFMTRDLFPSEAKLGVRFNGIGTDEQISLRAEDLAVDPDEIYHVVFTANETASNLYINGQQINLDREDAPGPGGLSGVPLGPDTLAKVASGVAYGISGGDVLESGYGYRGAVDNAAIYQGVLSEAQADDHYAGGRASFYPSEPIAITAAQQVAPGDSRPDEIVVSWGFPTWNGCGPADETCAISGYKATATPRGGGEAKSCISDSTPIVMGCTISGITYGTQYDISVVATNSVYAGDYGGNAGEATGSNPVVVQQKQQLLVEPLGGRTYGNPDVTVSAKSQTDGVDNPGLTPQLSVLSPESAPCAIVGGKVRITDTGTCNLEVTQPGDAAFEAAGAVPTSFQIVPAGLTLSGLEVVEKTYNGTVDVELDGSLSLAGIVPGDEGQVTVSCPAGQLTSASVGTHNLANAYCSLSGSRSSRYELNAPEAGLSGSISKRKVGISGLSVADKTYDGNDVATLRGTPSLTNTVVGDDVRLDGIPKALFNNAEVGDGKPVTVSGYSLAGVKAGNYSLDQPEGLKGSILAKVEPKPEPGPTPGPTPGPDPEPSPDEVTVLTPTQSQIKYSSRSISIPVKGQAPFAGQLVSTLTQASGSRSMAARKKTAKPLCRKKMNVQVGQYSWTCKLNSKVRKQLKKKAMKVTLTSVLTAPGKPSERARVTFTLKKKR